MWIDIQTVVVSLKPEKPNVSEESMFFFNEITKCAIYKHILKKTTTEEQ